MKTASFPFWIRLSATLLFFWALAPSSPFNISWVQSILILAPLVLVPLAWTLMSDAHKLSNALLFGGLAFGISYILPLGFLAGGFALVWLLCTLLLAWDQVNSYRHKKEENSKSFASLAAFLYLPIGATWALADRLGMHPMGFQSTIVLLTAVHFHYAGFLLLVAGHRIMALVPNSYKLFWDLLLVLGVPLVALGITLSQWEGPAWIETSSATVMAIGGLGVAVLHVLGSRQIRNTFVKWAWRIGAIFLSAGMCLALAYGWRPFFPLDFLSIPWMYAVHGTFNFLGVGILVTSWWFFDSSRQFISEAQ